MFDNTHYSKDRKYSLIDKKVSEWLKTDAKNGITGLCHDRFHADFEVADLTKYKEGDTIVVNGKKLIITIVGKNCYPNDCILFKKKKASCPLKQGVAFAKNA